MTVSATRFENFFESNPKIKKEAFKASGGDFELYCKILDLLLDVFVATGMQWTVKR